MSLRGGVFCWMFGWGWGVLLSEFLAGVGVCLLYLPTTGGLKNGRYGWRGVRLCVGGVGGFLNSLTTYTTVLKKISARTMTTSVGVVPIPIGARIRGNRFMLPRGMIVSCRATSNGGVTRCVTSGLGTSANCSMAMNKGGKGVSVRVSPSVGVTRRNCHLAIADGNMIVGTGAKGNTFCNVRDFVRLLPTRIRDTAGIDNIG